MLSLHSPSHWWLVGWSVGWLVSCRHTMNIGMTAKDICWCLNHIYNSAVTHLQTKTSSDIARTSRHFLSSIFRLRMAEIVGRYQHLRWRDDYNGDASYSSSTEADDGRQTYVLSLGVYELDMWYWFFFSFAIICLDTALVQLVLLLSLSNLDVWGRQDWKSCGWAV